MAPRPTRRGFLAGMVGVGVAAAMPTRMAAKHPPIVMIGEPGPEVIALPLQACTVSEIDYTTGMARIVCRCGSDSRHDWDDWEIRDITTTVSEAGVSTERTVRIPERRS